MDSIRFSTLASLKASPWLRYLNLSVRDSRGSQEITEMCESNIKRKTSDDAPILCKVIRFSGENHRTSGQTVPILTFTVYSAQALPLYELVFPIINAIFSRGLLSYKNTGVNCSRVVKNTNLISVADQLDSWLPHLLVL